MILSLFLFYEQVTRSSRMAGMATLIYMANPHFLFFDAIYSYETLALPLALFMLYILARYENTTKDHRWVIVFMPGLCWLP
jgi:Gpi18-like mannosyltransferase